MPDLLIPTHVAEERAAAIEQPSHQRYTVLVAELERATAQLATFELLEELEAVSPDGLGQNLLEFQFPFQKNHPIPRGHKLQVKLIGQRALVAELSRMLDEWNAQEEAFHAAQPATAHTFPAAVDETVPA